MEEYQCRLETRSKRVIIDRDALLVPEQLSFVSGIQTTTKLRKREDNNNYGRYSGATVSFCRPDKRIMTD